jgi:hypothetical protein
MNATIKLHRHRLISSAALYSEAIQKLTLEAEFFVRAKIEGDFRTYQPDAAFISLQMAQGIDALLDQDGESVSLPLYIEISNADDYVDASLPGATSTDEEGVETQTTWNDWTLDNHEIMTRGGRMFVGTNAHTGNDLTINELAGVMASIVYPSDLPEVDESEI